jgi:hypothetical protein
MVTFLITSFFILALAAIAIYLWQKPAASTEVEALPPPPPGRALFIDGTSDGQALALADAKAQATAAAAQLRNELRERARNGDKSTLSESLNQENTQLYKEILNLLVAEADSDPKLLSLVSYVTRHELPVNETLAACVVVSYKRAPDRNSTAKALHIAALSDDAGVYQNAVEVVMQLWRSGQLAVVPASELRSILDGEFWVLSSATRSSGAGFLLKRTLANARRELEAAPE